MSCIPICSNNLEVTKADLDRFTDRLENILPNIKGREFFKNFLQEYELTDGERCLLIYEKILDEEIKTTLHSDLIEVNILKLVEKIEEFDEEILHDIEHNLRVGNLRQALKLIKMEVVRLLHYDFNVFRRHYSRRSS